jgi:hypothetical protein
MMLNAPLIRAVKADRALFETDIVPAGQPVILKGLAADWPVVAAARTSTAALGDYLRRHDSRQPVSVSVCPNKEQGRFFYNENLTGLNYVTGQQSLSNLVGWCLAAAGHDNVDAVYLQAQPVHQLAPSMAADLAMPLLSASVHPRLWIGNTLRTQTHFDYFANIAVHVAGEKTFTLFAPDQTGNLYPGPLDRTPAGVPVSMPSLEDPDFEHYPRLKEAMANAVRADLEPGDGLYIPPLWWHHVKTTGPLNMLVNYWWNPARPDLINPTSALNIAALAWKEMPDYQRQAWRELLNYFVFEDKGDPVAHLPEGAQGLFKPKPSPQEMAAFTRKVAASGT